MTYSKRACRSNISSQLSIPIMKCRACNSEMVVDHCESSQHATTCWHQCPLCKHVRLTSEKETTVARTQFASVAHKDDDGGYPAELEYQLGNPHLAL